VHGQPSGAIHGDLGHAAHALDDLDEERRAVAERLGEDLQQNALLVGVCQHAQLLCQSVLLGGERVAEALRQRP